MCTLTPSYSRARPAKVPRELRGHQSGWLSSWEGRRSRARGAGNEPSARRHGPHWGYSDSGEGAGKPKGQPRLALQPHLCPSRPPRLLGLLPEVIWVAGKGEGRSWGAYCRRRSASLHQWAPPSPRSLRFCPWAAFQGRLVNSRWASPPPTTPGKRPHQRPSRTGPQSHSRANEPLRRPRRSQLRAEGGCGEGPEQAGAGAGLASQGQGGEGQAAGVPPPLAVVALSFPWPAENAGSGHSDAWSLKSHILFSSRSAACLWLGEVRPRGPAGVTPGLEKLLRGAGAAGRGPVHHHSPHRGRAAEPLQPARGPPPRPDPSSGLQGLCRSPRCH